MYVDYLAKLQTRSDNGLTTLLDAIAELRLPIAACYEQVSVSYL